MYDITLTGSIIGSDADIAAAQIRAKDISEFVYPGRLIRVHDVDGETVIAEYRDGLALAQV